MVVSIAVALLVVVAAVVGLWWYVDNNRHDEERLIEKAYAEGFVEKQVEVSLAALPSLTQGGEAQLVNALAQESEAPQANAATQGRETPPADGVVQDGVAVVNYAEGPDNGPALLLVHGQGMQWEDYARMLPAGRPTAVSRNADRNATGARLFCVARCLRGDPRLPPASRRGGPRGILCPTQLFVLAVWRLAAQDRGMDGARARRAPRRTPDTCVGAARLGAGQMHSQRRSCS